MKKFLAILGLVGLTSAAPQMARSEVNFSIFISNAPPPPRVVFVHQPRFVLVPDRDVYYCEDDYSDYDVFRYGSYFYLYDEGYWYRASSYRGPFVAIRIDYVPSSIFYVSDYGYHWRQTPRWGRQSYARWNSGDRRFRDWRSTDRRDRGDWRDRDLYGERRVIQPRSGDRRVSQPRDGDRWRTRGLMQVREPDRDRGDRRLAQAPQRSRDGDRNWRDGRDSRDRRGNQPDEGQGKAKGKGKGKSQGQGHGRGHDKD